MKRTLALVLGLAAVLLFAPVARADFHGGKSPYRDLAGPLGHASDIQPADAEDDHDGDANDGSHQDDGSNAADTHDDHDHDDDGTSCDDDHEDEHENAQAQAHEQEGSDDGDDDCAATGENPGSGSDTGNQPGTNPGTNPGGPSTQSVPSNPSLWLWVLLVVIAGAGVATAYVVRRKMRAR